MGHLAKNVLITLPENPTAAVSTGKVSDWVDCANYEGCLFLATLGAGTTSGTFKIQYAASTTATGSDLSGATRSISGSDDNKAVAIDVYSPHGKGRYLRSSFATTGGGGTWDYSGTVAIRYNGRKGAKSSTSLVDGDIDLVVVQTT